MPLLELLLPPTYKTAGHIYLRSLSTTSCHSKQSPTSPTRAACALLSNVDGTASPPKSVPRHSKPSPRGLQTSGLSHSCSYNTVFNLTTFRHFASYCLTLLCSLLFACGGGPVKKLPSLLLLQTSYQPPIPRQTYPTTLPSLNYPRYRPFDFVLLSRYQLATPSKASNWVLSTQHGPVGLHSTRRYHTNLSRSRLQPNRPCDGTVACDPSDTTARASIPALRRSR